MTVLINKYIGYTEGLMKIVLLLRKIRKIFLKSQKKSGYNGWLGNPKYGLRN